MVKSKSAFALAALAVSLVLLAVGCDGVTPVASPVPTPTPLAPLPAPSPIPFDTVTPVPTGTPRVRPSPSYVSLRPATPEGWSASLIVSGRPNATESGPIGPDGLMYVSWAVTNTGSEDADLPFSVDLVVDGVPVERWLAATGLDVGEVQTIRDWADLPIRANLAPGPHELRLVVDSTGYLQPLDTPDNNVSVTFDWPELPAEDLQLSLAPSRLPNLEPYFPEGWTDAIRLQGVPRSVNAALTATPSLEIAYSNEGLSSISRFFFIYVYLDGVLVTKFNQHGLIAREAVVTPPWVHLLDTIYVSPGRHTLTLELDPTGLVPEADETDNTVSIDFNWAGPALVDADAGPSPADAAPAILEYVPSGWSGSLVVSGYRGETSLPSAAYLSSQAYVNWAMKNHGGALRSPYTVELLISGEVVHTWERESLAAGAIDLLVDEPIPAAFAQGIHAVELRVRTAGGDVVNVARVPANWRTGFVPPRGGAPLDDGERRRRLALIEDIRSSVEPLSASPELRQGVIDVADLVYRSLYNRSLAEEAFSLSILTDEEFGAWVDAECGDVAPTLSAGARTIYLERCTQAKGFGGYYSEWRGVSRIVARSDRPPMQVLSTIAHELGHFRQARSNPSLNDQVNLDIVALREAQAYAHQAAFFRTLESLAGLDLLLYPRLNGYEAFVEMRIGDLRARAETSEHARGRLVLWLAVLSDPELRPQRTVLLNNLVMPAQTAREVYDYLSAFSPGQARLYVNRIMGNVTAQIGAIESIVSARLIPGLPYWNEGSPELREVGLLLP